MKIKIILLLLLIILSYSNSYGTNVQQVSHYSTDIQIKNGNTLEVSKTISLKNIHIKGLIPGEVRFNVGNEFLMLDENSIQVKDIYENIIDFEVIIGENNNEIIVLNIEYPVLPEFIYTFYLNYNLDFRSRGIFFKTLEIPNILSTIDVDKGDFSITIPPTHSITYVYPRGNMTTITDSTLKINLNNPQIETIYLEYSIIPLPMTPIRGTIIFWSFIYLIIFLVIVRLIRKEVKKFYAKQEHKN